MTGHWVQTSAVDAIVTFADGESIPGRIHLHQSPNRSGEETPLERLNRTEPIFPLTFDDGGVAFVSKAQVVMVRCDWPVSEEERELLETAGAIRLRVALASGEEFEGEGSAILPPGARRALDYLNLPEDFFLLRVEGGARLINKRYLRAARPLD